LERIPSDTDHLKALDNKLKERQARAKALQEALVEGERKVVAAEDGSKAAGEKFNKAKAAAGTPAEKKEAAGQARRDALDVLKLPVKEARTWLQQQVASGATSKEQLDVLKKRVSSAEETMQDLMSSAKALADAANKEEKAAAA